MNVLLVEDYPLKAHQIIECLKKEFSISKIVTRSSYHSAYDEIVKKHKNYDIILLNLSMSIFEENNLLPEDTPDLMAGRSILEGMFLRDINTKVLVVSMFENFDKENISELNELFRCNYPGFYEGYVSFSFNDFAWKTDLIKKIQRIL